MSVIINPGSGPVAGATYANAVENVATFASEVGADPEIKVGEDKGDGRWAFTISKGDTSHEIEMPGLPLERVRYIGAEAQNIWDFPRLYVDGSSWIWEFALRQCFRADEA